MADKDLRIRFGVGHLSYKRKQRTRITYKATSPLTGGWISENCSSTEWYQNRGEGVLNLRKDVTSIGGTQSTDDSPFYGQTGVTEVDLTNSGIVQIKGYSFYGCTNLDSILLPSDLTQIKNSVFYNCSSLTSIDIPSGLVEIGSNSFHGCSSLTQVNGLGETSITTLALGTFQDTALTSIDIPSTVTAIGGSAFRGCTGLTSVTIPSGVTSIDDWAFRACTNLRSVTCEATTPPTLGTNNFTANNDTLYVPYASLSAYQNDSQWSAAFTTIRPIGDYYQITVTAGEHGSATGSGWYALNESATLTATADEGYEFTQWSDGNTDNPRTVTVLGDATYTCAFQALKLIRYTSTNQASGQWVTNNTDTTRNTYDSTTHEGVLYLNENITEIGGGSSKDYTPFYNDSGLTAVDLDDAGLTDIGDRAFYRCANLSSITIPNTVTSIGDTVFQGCTGLTSITIPNTVTSIGNTTFDGCTGLTSITIPNSVTSIGQYAFVGCTGLTSATIGSGVTNISNSAFSGCTGLTSISIPSGVTNISNSAFSGCTNLTSVTCLATIPPALGNGNFTASYDTLYVPSASVSAYQAASAWRNAFDVIRYIGFEGVIRYNAPTAVSGNWVTNNTDTTKNTYNSQTGDGVLYLNANVMKIGGGTNTNYSPFYSKTDLVSVDLSDSGLITLDRNAFLGCSGLTSFTIPSSVTRILDGLFNGCSGLTSINIPNTVTAIGVGLFSDCSALASITVESSSTYYNDGNGSNCIIQTTNNQLLAGCKNTVIPNTVTSIVSEAFYGCSGLTSINIPSSVGSIGNNAFRNCSSLASVTIGSGVTSINVGVFNGCSSLTSITIPSGVTAIGNYAFNCSNLTSVTCEATTPPTLGTPNFGASNNTLYVPAASVSAYQSASAWSSAFTTITAIPTPVQHTISYTTGDPQYGASAVDGNWVTNNTDTTQNTYATVAGQYGNIGEGVLYLNSGVTTIGGGQSTDYSPFYVSGMNHYTDGIDLSDSGLTSIGDYGLYDCNAEFDPSDPLVIPEGVTTIGDHGLGASSTGGSDCYYDLPSTLTSIASNGIYIGGSKGAIAVMICRATTPPTLGTNSISAPDGLWTLQVPAASVSAYQSSAWGSLGFSTITAIS